MQVSDELVNKMLLNLPEDQQQQMANILKGEVAYEVICNSEDQYDDRLVQVLDDDGERVYFKSGKKKGQPKTEVKHVLVQEGAKGRVIAHIMTDGTVVPTNDENGKMWLRASRRRMDGEWGFQSWCGTDSLLAEAEKGIIGQAQPSKDDLFEIAKRLDDKPPKYATIKGEREVDGFIIREVRK